MKKLLVMMLMVFVLFALSACGGNADEGYDLTEEYVSNYNSVEAMEDSRQNVTIEYRCEWFCDINQFRDHVTRWHPLFANGDLMHLPENLEKRQLFDESIDILLGSLPALTDFEIKVALQRSAAILRDNHFVFEDFLYRDMMINRYPLVFRWFSDGYYLYQSHEEFKNALNHRLVAINDVSIDDIFRMFTGFWSVENIYDARSRFAYAINSPLLLKALGVTDGTETRYIFAGSQGETFDILPVTTYLWDLDVTRGIFLPVEELTDNRAEGELPLFLQFQEGHWYAFLEEYGVFYIRIQVYMMDVDRVTWETGVFYRAIRDRFEEIDVRAVIIDARGNPGGYHFHRPLFSFLAEYGVMLFGFVDESSRSGSLVAAFNLYCLGAVIVGQPLGQATQFFYLYGTTYMPWDIQLNYSGYRVLVSTGPWIIEEYRTEPADRVFRPHVLIDYTIDDWVYNRDPMFEYVLGLLCYTRNGVD